MPEKKGKKLSVVETVTELTRPLAEELGLSIWDIRYEKEGAAWFLRVYVDSPEGLTMDTCEELTRKLDVLLDEHDPVPESYYLEVGSPGIDRKLQKDEHFLLSLGKEVEVRLIRPEQGVRELRGVLSDYRDGVLTIRTIEGERTIEKNKTASVRLYFDFEN